MFLAKYINGCRVDSQKEDEYIVKITYRAEKKKSWYLCSCGNRVDGPSFTTVDYALHRDVKIFKTPTEAIKECLKAFNISNNEKASYRISIINRPKSVFAIRFPRGFGWEYFLKKCSLRVISVQNLEDAHFFSSFSFAQKKLQKLNQNKYIGLTGPFEIIKVTADMLN